MCAPASWSAGTSEQFGWSVAAVGTDRVLVGAPGHYAGDVRVGAAYLFSTNGALLTTFTNPAPTTCDPNGDWFGLCLIPMGPQRVLVGAPYDDTGATNAGAAYLFSTNGTLLTTFTKPSPVAGDGFGISLATSGNDRVLIGAGGDDTGATNAGAAYLFNTNGTLLATFTNPTPEYRDYFGHCVATVGTDRVLIGAYGDNTGATNAGAAYLFSTNGVLLTTITNPTPADSDYFGASVAAAGTNQVLIDARWDDTGATDAGAAYLLALNRSLQ